MTLSQIKRIFLLGGIGGVLAISPLVILGILPGLTFPPDLQGHENFHRLNLGGALLIQFLIIYISFDPKRLRRLMVIPMLEKLLAVLILPILLVLGVQIHPVLWIVPIADGVLGILFYKAYAQLKS